MRSSASVFDHRPAHTGALALARECGARRRRARLRRFALLIGALAASAMVALWAGWPWTRAPIGHALALLDDHAMSIGFFTGLFAGKIVRRARRFAEREFARSWLASAPLARGEVVDAVRRQVAMTVAPRFLVPLAVVTAFGLATRFAIGHLLAFASAGIALGSFAGWRAGARTLPTAPLSIPRLGHTRHANASAAGFEALCHWPFAQWLADATPRAHAHIVAAVLLGLPMGIPLPVALLLLMLLANTLVTIGLLRALLATIPAAADALRSTPLPLPRLAMLLGRRVAFWQAAAAMLGAAIAYALGATPVLALTGFCAWLLVATLAVAWQWRKTTHA